jgi:aminopeptidase N
VFRALIAAVAAVALFSCRADDAPSPATELGTVAPILDTPDAIDVYSYAKPLEARVANVDLDLTLDFEARQIKGVAGLDIVATPNAQQVILDTKGLEINSVTAAGGEPLKWAVGAADPDNGAPLTVSFKKGGNQRIIINYRSAPGAAALQWLAPEQTAGKKHPYLLSQGQPTLNRTWIPTQDSPGIRQTWSARVTAPEPLKVVMSGDRLTPGGEAAGQGLRAYRFRMDKPVAPYLIAIAAGDLAFRELGPRTGVWTEPVMLDAAAAELADTEKMVEAAEKLYGPYRWGRYDVIVLPPSFPYGGMENPTLTFLTPTFIAGDKSLVGLVAHELAHSWSGNLVTNATWADGWLNEGFTSYFENRIMEAIYGPRRAQQEAALSFDDMMESLEEEGMNAPTTRLHLAAAEARPDGGATGVVYDKGAAFLRTLERLVGRERFDAWLRSYFDRYAFQPMTSAKFLADFRENLVKDDKALEARLMLDQWVYQPGLPGNVVRPDPGIFAQVDAQVRAVDNGAAPDRELWDAWTTNERLRFLTRLGRKQSRQKLDRIEGTLQLNEASNNEVMFAWLELAVANRYDPAVPALERFLTVQGRRKFVRPLITVLAGDPQWGRPIAARIYAKARASYHPVTTRDLDKLGLLPKPKSTNL